MSPAAFQLREDGRSVLKAATESVRSADPAAYDAALAHSVKLADEEACARRRASGACPLWAPRPTLAQRITRLFERIRATFLFSVLG